MPVTEEERTALALVALGEITDPADVGELLGTEQPEPGVIDLRFACTLSAYPGWSWVVSTSDLPDQAATVLEVELLPGDGALLAPPWVPWTERLAEWRRQHPDERHPGEESLDDEIDVEDDEVPDDEDADLDEDDLAVDDDLDVLDETELDGEETHDAADDDEDEPDDEPDDDELSGDEREIRPADEDRGP